MVIVSSVEDTFFREIHKVEVFSSEHQPYIKALLGGFVPHLPLLVFENIVSEELEYSVERKAIKGNYYYEIDIIFPIYTTDISKIGWVSLLNARKFVVKLSTNTDYIGLGNSMEPLLVECTEALVNDNSGEDKLMVRVSGSTIIRPIRKGI